MKQICTIIIPVITMSNNELLRMHWAERRRIKEQYGWELIAVGANQPKYLAGMGEYRAVRIMSYRPRLLDYDNLVGGAKLLTDSLVDLGLLCDDSPKYTSVSYFQKVDDNPRTEIIIFNGGEE